MKKYTRKYNTPEYRKRYTGIYCSWYAMKQRCDNPNNNSYKNYGGRGISYISSWKVFANFREDMNENYKKGLTLERVDNSKGYSKENCSWATRTEQSRNKRTNIVLKNKGRKMTIREWSEKIGLSYATIRSRYTRGMSVEDILQNKLFRPAKLLEINRGLHVK